VRTNRVFVEQPLESDAVVEIGGSAGTHITRVLRVRPGEDLIVFDGKGGEYEARVESLRKDSAFVAVGAHRAVERESPLAITLAQGISRGERMDLVVQKATELGVRHIVPLLTGRSVVRLDRGQADAKRRHWRAIAVAACEQCGRNQVPEVAVPEGLDRFFANASTLSASTLSGSARIVLSPHGKTRVRDLKPGTGVVLLIGPEGGLSEAELETSVRVGFEPVRLGPRILRTETAAIAALAVIQQQLGDF